MPRHLCLLLLLGGLAAAGCRTCNDRAALFPRQNNAVAGLQDSYADRFRDRYALPAATDPCLPCSGLAGGYPTAGLAYGSPAVYGGYAVPATYSSTPGLGVPVYPSGNSVPVSPRRDDELPLPGEYSQPGAVEQGRIAPKPASSLPTAGK